MNHASLFSGIGGFDLAAEWAGWTNVFNCEIDEFCQKVLKYHFPNAIQLTDIKQAKFKRDDRGNVYIRRIITDTEILHDRRNAGTMGEKEKKSICKNDGAESYSCSENGWDEKEIWQNIGPIDIITGGFPCQPFSMAGKRRGTEDDRHLWPEMLRAIREIKPRWIVGENVFGLTNWNGGMVFDEVLSDLENEGYEVQPFIIPAAGVNAPHRRDRVWIVAHAKDLRNRRNCGTVGNKTTKSKCKNDGAEFDGRGKNGTTSDTTKAECKQSGHTRSGGNGFTDNITGWHNFPTQPPLRSRDDGFPGGLDGITVSKLRNESIKAYGNAIVPQVAYEIFKAINKCES